MIEKILTLQDEVDLIKSSEISFYDAIKVYLSLPGLRGFWPMSGTGTSGLVLDATRNGLDLTLNGNVTLNHFNNTIPYADFPGDAGDLLSRADEALLDITGADTGINSAIQGLTAGAWVNQDVVENVSWIGKGDTDNFSWGLSPGTSGQVVVEISDDGILENRLLWASSLTISANTWSFVACRYIASTEVTAVLNGSIESSTSSIPASIFSGSGTLRLGASYLSNFDFNGQMTLAFMCAAALPDATLRGIYQATRGLFGV